MLLNRALYLSPWDGAWAQVRTLCRTLAQQSSVPLPWNGARAHSYTGVPQKDLHIFHEME